ncbi:MAG: T9SS type A sorting domain-containing protein, partial [Bacteroidetes bacterium]|nr:T9SS type A sorting domain-containing protein [Bacteroidota bacterium]
IFTGGWFAGVGDGAGGIGPPAPNNNTSTVNVTGDFIMSDGEFDDYVSGNSSALTILTIGGNIEITGGIWNFDKATGGDSQINLDGGTASVTWEQTGGTVTLCNTFIKSGKTVTLSGTTMGDIESGRSIDVQSGGRLNCSTYPVEGAGAFDLQSGGTLGIGSADGITDAAASGNVQVAGTRTYSSLANYVYNGTSAQVTNVFTTTPTDTTVYTLTIDNTGSGVTLSDWDASMSGDLTVTSVLALDNGEFDLSSERIIVTNGATSGITRSAGYILSESESSIVRWEMDGTTGTDYTFPFGYSSTYIPFVFNKSTAAVDVELTTWHTATDNTPLPSGAGTPADPTNWVDRWWTIAAPSATAICDFAFTSAEESGLVNPDTIKHWNGAAYDEYTGTYSSASAISNSALSAWGPFSIGTGSTPLPIALGSFTGVSVDNGIQLEWTTFSELNNDYFEVETSEDGFANYYWTVGYVNGAGNSLEEINYSLMDKWPFFGLNYYRLRQVDNNGKQSVSKIIAVYYSGGETLHAYPTVAHDYVNIMFISSRQEDAVIYLYDMNGKVVLTQNITSMGKGVYYCTLDLTGLSASGMYTLVMEQGNHHRQTKIVKF